MEEEFERLLNLAKQEIASCLSLLERTEAAKETAFNYLDSFIQELSNSNPDKIIRSFPYIVEAWNIYKSYDDELLPLAHKNIREANKNLDKLKQ